GPRLASRRPRATRAPRPGTGTPIREGRGSAAPRPGLVATRRPRRPRKDHSTPAASAPPAVPPPPAANREACRTTSWLESTHVVGAPTASIADRDWSMTRRYSAPDHGAPR